MKEILRTPDSFFDDIADFPYDPNYIDDLPEYEGIRIHYVDTGKREGDTILCVHGEPTWAYVYRKMIKVFEKNEHRVIAPDLIGFGRSDKPVDEKIYTFDFHRNMILHFIEKLDLKKITLVVQDWGGILGLTIPMEYPDRIEKLIIMNTMLATGDIPLSPGFRAWRSWAAENEDMNVGSLMPRACPHLSEEEKNAYSCPFPDLRFKSGVRAFPKIVPEFPNSPGASVSRAARSFLQSSWQGQTFMAIGKKDPVLGPSVMNQLREDIRGCSCPFVVEEAGHFLQEWGDGVAIAALDYFANLDF